jgi:hypothetical protein
MRTRSVVRFGVVEPFDEDTKDRAARRLARLASSLLASGAIEPPAHSLALPPVRTRRLSREKR